MKNFSIITVKSVTGYNEDDIITDEVPLAMFTYEGHIPLDIVLQNDEDIADIVNGLDKGDEIQVIIDYMEYEEGVDDETESKEDIQETLDLIMDNLSQYLNSNLIIMVDTDDAVITVEEPASMNSSIVELDTIED